MSFVSLAPGCWDGLGEAGAVRNEKCLSFLHIIRVLVIMERFLAVTGMELGLLLWMLLTLTGNTAAAAAPEQYSRAVVSSVQDKERLILLKLFYLCGYTVIID